MKTYYVLNRADGDDSSSDENKPRKFNHFNNNNELELQDSDAERLVKADDLEYDDGLEDESPFKCPFVELYQKHEAEKHVRFQMDENNSSEVSSIEKSTLTASYHKIDDEVKYQEKKELHSTQCNIPKFPQIPNFPKNLKIFLSHSSRKNFFLLGNYLGLQNVETKKAKILQDLSNHDDSMSERESSSNSSVSNLEISDLYSKNSHYEIGMLNSKIDNYYSINMDGGKSVSSDFNNLGKSNESCLNKPTSLRSVTCTLL